MAISIAKLQAMERLLSLHHMLFLKVKEMGDIHRRGIRQYAGGVFYRRAMRRYPSPVSGAIFHRRVITDSNTGDERCDVVLMILFHRSLADRVVLAPSPLSVGCSVARQSHGSEVFS